MLSMRIRIKNDKGSVDVKIYFDYFPYKSTKKKASQDEFLNVWSSKYELSACFLMIFKCFVEQIKYNFFPFVYENYFFSKILPVSLFKDHKADILTQERHTQMNILVYFPASKENNDLADEVLTRSGLCQRSNLKFLLKS